MTPSPLLLAMASPEIELLAVTVAGGLSSGWTARYRTRWRWWRWPARRCQCSPAPTARCWAASPARRGCTAWPASAAWRCRRAGPRKAEHAADAIRRILRTTTRPVTLVGASPRRPTLALALITEPALAPNVDRIVLMTGAWAEGNATPAAEFNALADPEALAILLACSRPVVLVTLDLTAQALCTPARLAALRAAGPGRGLRAVCDIQATVPLSRRFDRAGAALHDPLRDRLAAAPRPLFLPRLRRAGRSRPWPQPRPHADRPLEPQRRAAKRDSAGDDGRRWLLLHCLPTVSSRLP